jgi:hypothetical protein
VRAVNTLEQRLVQNPGMSVLGRREACCAMLLVF